MPQSGWVFASLYLPLANCSPLLSSSPTRLCEQLSVLLCLPLSHALRPYSLSSTQPRSRGTASLALPSFIAFISSRMLCGSNASLSRLLTRASAVRHPHSSSFSLNVSSRSHSISFHLPHRAYPHPTTAIAESFCPNTHNAHTQLPHTTPVELAA